MSFSFFLVSILLCVLFFWLFFLFVLPLRPTSLNHATLAVSDLSVAFPREPVSSRQREREREIGEKTTVRFSTTALDGDS